MRGRRRGNSRHDTCNRAKPRHLGRYVVSEVIMAKKILITGGAGFIGSHLADELLQRGHSVRVLDNLSPQVHPESKRPAYLSRDVELQIGDVRDEHAVRKALLGIDVVYHLAAMVG